jgi:hypothetical protein
MTRRRLRCIRTLDDLPFRLVVHPFHPAKGEPAAPAYLPQGAGAQILQVQHAFQEP